MGFRVGARSERTSEGLFLGHFACPSLVCGVGFVNSHCTGHALESALGTIRSSEGSRKSDDEFRGRRCVPPSSSRSRPRLFGGAQHVRQPSTRSASSKEATQAGRPQPSPACGHHCQLLWLDGVWWVVGFEASMQRVRFSAMRAACMAHATLGGAGGLHARPLGGRQTSSQSPCFSCLTA